MFDPDLPEIGSDSDLGIEVPDDAAAAIKIERKRRREDFKILRAEIARVSIFGANNKFDRSFHTLPLSDGSIKILFGSIYLQKIGKSYRIIENQELSGNNDDRYLDIHDYIVADGANIISYNYSWLHKQHHQHRWRDLTDYHGPILGLRGAKPVIMEGKDYEVAIPEYNNEIIPGQTTQLTEVILRHKHVEDLTKMLSNLNEVSCEEIIC